MSCTLEYDSYCLKRSLRPIMFQASYKNCNSKATGEPTPQKERDSRVDGETPRGLRGGAARETSMRKRYCNSCDFLLTTFALIF